MLAKFPKLKEVTICPEDLPPGSESFLKELRSKQVKVDIRATDAIKM